MSVYKRVREIISAQLGKPISAIHPETSLHEWLEADSLDVVELAVFVEEEFGIDMPDEDARKLPRIADIVSYIESKTKD